ncbi:uncharacterized protein LODBEIA_P41570 [Lodderomyces beijingensis]|uniref:Methionine aminopeptidase 2 n=1 Tax=Lodderomyces beijingensis TaxID=1775926 RepID=A0ABP0ZQG7_9ASCO
MASTEVKDIEAKTDGLKLDSVETTPKSASNANASPSTTKTGEDGDEDDQDEEDDNGGGVSANTTSDPPKNKKKKKKSNKKKKLVSIEHSYPDGIYPEGQWLDHPMDSNTYRTTSEEMRYLDNQNMAKWQDFRKGAEIHRRVRAKAKSQIRPGMTMLEIADIIESSIRTYAGNVAAKVAGVGFPTGLSLNHVAAHYTPNTGDKKVLASSDIMKVDIGVHVNGRICDSAFTMTFDETGKYDEILAAVRDATYTGVRESGIDVRLNDVGAAIQEVMESYETRDGTAIKCIRNLNGHNIGDYVIHGGKSVPIIANGDMTKMEEGEVFAIETFGSTGQGYVVPEGECSHYALNAGMDAGVKGLSERARALFSKIDASFGTLPWCRRYLEREGEEKYLFALNQLVRAGVVEDYPPIVDKRGSYTAQFEHTIILHPHRKEVVTKGDDY